MTNLPTIHLNYDDPNSEFHAAHCYIVSTLAAELKERLAYDGVDDDRITDLEVLEYEFYAEADSTELNIEDFVEVNTQEMSLEDVRRLMVDNMKETSFMTNEDEISKFETMGL